MEDDVPDDAPWTSIARHELDGPSAQAGKIAERGELWILVR